MGQRAARNSEIRNFILAEVAKYPDSIVRRVAETFAISITAANKHIRKLIEEGVLRAEGETSDRRYFLMTPEREFLFEKQFGYDLTQALDEDVIWRSDLKPLIHDLPKNVVDLWGYCATEMINNAIDHSAGSRLSVCVQAYTDKVQMIVLDDGEGIFRKIKRVLGLIDERQALFELKKGKLTTDKERHSGQGIFFTSRMCDDFWIVSHQLIFSHKDGQEQDWLTSIRDQAFRGTTVIMEIQNQTDRTAKRIHDQYSSDDESYQFSKTVVPIHLAAEGEGLISRSQAKRLLLRVEQFQVVILDFEGIEAIGQGFADEVFRVFARQHPHVRLYPLNTNEAVSQMIARAILTRDEA